MNAAPLRVDFSYAFATPHRMTVALPDSSNKTLLDLQPGSLGMSWTFGDLLNTPLATFCPPKTEWAAQIRPLLDDQPFAESRWTRAEGWLPVLVNEYGDTRASVRLEAVGGKTAALIRVEVINSDDKPHDVSLRSERAGSFMGFNPAWVQPEWDRDILLAGWHDRAERVLLLAIGGDEMPVVAVTTLSMVWHLQPGETQTGWIVRPYEAYQSGVPTLRHTDWAREFEAAKKPWYDLLGRAGQLDIPDAGVLNAFRAALADCFIMREPMAQGYVAACPGTECYRAANPVEAAILAVLLDQCGLHEESATGYQLCLDLQGPDGNWNDPDGWCHYMWAGAGFKAWAVMEHYRLTGDRDYLASLYPRLLANSRWQEHERARTRNPVEDERPLTYGLMPRGMGDCGLMNDNDMYGVYLPHNIWAVFADAVSMAAAEILGKTADLPELRRIHETALADLLAALEGGAIAEDGYRWIPAVAGKTSGSRWGALNAAFPCNVLPPDHELITGTIRKVESLISPGGIPVHTGWMKDGMWVAITLDNLAEVLLTRDEGDAAAAYLYATLNHGTPLFSWCEERGQEPGATKCSGDRQHLWTPIAVGRFIRDAMVMEQGNTLHLACGSARQWLADGQSLGVQDMPTHFGRISYELRYDAATGRVTGHVDLPAGTAPCLVLHVRLPDGLTLATVQGDAEPTLDRAGSVIEWQNLTGMVHFEATVQG